MQVKPGKKDALRALIAADDRQVAGSRAFYLFDAAGDECWGVAIFDDEQSYRANADSPGQQTDYGQMRELLVADPEWHDGTVFAWPGNRA
jgi:hypothetical protein